MKNLILTWLKPNKLVPLIFIGGITLICSAFFIEYVLEVKPCQMCWWQRYIHWGITAIALLGFLTKKYIVALYGIAIGSLSGFYVAVWHTLVQQKIIAPPGCGNTGDVMPLNPTDLMATINAGSFTLPSCDRIDFTILGFSLANWNIVVMLTFILVASYSICYNRHK